ncbi:MAG: PAS domain-containing protein, partial [Bryobacteraceae bacterium]
MSDLAVGRARYPKINLPELNFRALFDAVPVPCLVFLPDDPAFTVVAVNRTFEQATLIRPEEVLGRSLPEVSRENLGAVYGDDLQASVYRVLETKAADTMAVKECQLRRLRLEAPPVDQGRLPRYWRPSNIPVIGDAGDITCIIHRLEDATEIVELQRLVSERQRIEKRLLATEAHFSLAFAKAPTGMALLTPDGAISDVNQAFVDMLGYTRDELISGDSSQYTHPDDIELTKNFLATLRDGPECSGNIEKRYVRKDGEVLWACASAAMRHDDLGRPVQIIAIVEDITARKRAEARYRFLAESIPPIVWTATPGGSFDYINCRGTAYIGAAVEKMIGGWWVEWIHPDEQQQAAARWKHSVETGEPFEIEFRLERASDKSWRWFLARALPLATDRGQIAQWFGTCTDIEDQKQADANLLHQWQNFDTALSHTPDFTYIFDCSGRVIYVNRALLSVWQRSLEEVRGKNFYGLEYPPELAERLQHQIQEVVETRQEVHDQMPLAGPGAEIRHYDYTFVPVFGNDGRVEAVGGSARDITEHIRIQEALAASEERLRQVFAQAPVAIVVFRGRDFVVELANPYYQALVQGRELVGRRFADIVPELGENVWEAFHRVLDTGEAFVATDFHVP